MSDQEVAQLVEKIVLRVLQRIQSDEELAALVKNDQPDKNTWARTCSTYRREDAPAAPSSSISVPSQPEVVSPKTESQSSVTKKLYTEQDIVDLAKAGQKLLIVSPKTILTPSARDAAKSKGISIQVKE